MAVLDHEKTIEVAHLMSSEFHHWLVQQALEGEWEKEDVADIVCRENAENQLIMTTLDFEIQKHAAVFNQEKTTEVAHLMSPHFVQWLIQ